MEWILRNQTWHFDKQLFVIAPLVGNEQPFLIKLTRASFWIRAYDLPVNCLNKKTAKALADRVGIFVYMDGHLDNYVGSYLRFKAVVDVTLPLLRGLTIKLAENRMWIPLKYESIPAFCFNCGIIGHQMKSCTAEKKVYQHIEDISYGPWLKASPLKRSRMNREARSSSGFSFPRELFKESSSSSITPPLMDPTTSDPSRPCPNTCNSGGRKRGVALLWGVEWKVSILSSSLHHINADVGQWRFCGIYGWPEI
ncbi:hypothetical protein C2S52_019147 [Perilla frutescens var. hirtella]|nr:hypothetical protein C2S52_019147 [Perilla frutescens var. hirtella]